eukprot:3886384-Amphidinium_carterae.4
MRRDVWVSLPPENPRSSEPDVCAKLERSLYGTRDADQNFELLVADVMNEIGYANGIWSPCIDLCAPGTECTGVCLRGQFCDEREQGTLEGIQAEAEWSYDGQGRGCCV